MCINNFNSVFMNANTVAKKSNSLELNFISKKVKGVKLVLTNC